MRSSIPLAIIFLLACVTYFSNRSPNVQLVQPIKNAPDFSFSNVSISMHSGGKKAWTLTAAESAIYSTSGMFFFDSVSGNIQGNDGTVEFSSPTGGFSMKNQRLKLVKTSAEIRFSDTRYYLLCDEIEINAKKSQLFGYGNLSINSDQFMLTGKKIMADLLRNRIRILDHVEGSIIPLSID